MPSASIFGSAIALAVVALTLTGCKKDVPSSGPETGEVAVHLVNGVSGPGTAFSSLVLDATTYKNANGDAFTVSTFKYYLSNVKLVKADNSVYSVPDKYFLIDHANAASQLLVVTGVPVADYTAVTFTVGVDSARTKAGGFTGVLNANNGMFWDMNGPEFINLKLEGRSPQSPSTGLVFHLAGYKGAANNTIRTVTVPFGASKLAVRPTKQPIVYLRADIAKLFTGPNPTTSTPPPFLNPVSFATVYNKMGGPAASKLADNLAAGMFSFDRIDAK